MGSFSLLGGNKQWRRNHARHKICKKPFENANEQRRKCYEVGFASHCLPHTDLKNICCGISGVDISAMFGMAGRIPTSRTSSTSGCHSSARSRPFHVLALFPACHAFLQQHLQSHSRSQGNLLNAYIHPPFSFS
jgi:hypothetical protein